MLNDAGQHCSISSLYTFTFRWLGGLLVERRTNVSQILGSTPGQVVARYRVKTLGKFLTPVCNVVLYNII